MLAEEAERSGCGSRTSWLWKTIVLAGEGKCSGSVVASALVEEDRCFLQWKTSVQAVEDERAGRGRQVCWLWKMSVQAEENERADRGRRTCLLWKEYEFHEDVRRAGERGNVGWQVR